LEKIKKNLIIKTLKGFEILAKKIFSLSQRASTKTKKKLKETGWGLYTTS